MFLLHFLTKKFLPHFQTSKSFKSYQILTSIKMHNSQSIFHIHCASMLFFTQVQFMFCTLLYHKLESEPFSISLLSFTLSDTVIFAVCWYPKKSMKTTIQKILRKYMETELNTSIDIVMDSTNKMMG